MVCMLYEPIDDIKQIPLGARVFISVAGICPNLCGKVVEHKSPTAVVVQIGDTYHTVDGKQCGAIVHISW